MDKELKLASDLVTLMIVHRGQYPNKAGIEAASRRVVTSNLAPGVAFREDELVKAISAKYPPVPERIGRPLVWR
jgi:hypothetical protein